MSDWDLLDRDRWKVRVCFLEPYRVAEDEKQQKLRNNCVVWARDSYGDWRLQLRGDLLYRKVREQADFLAALEKRLRIENESPPFIALECCSARSTAPARGGRQFLRRRQCYDSGISPDCTQFETACPICLLRGFVLSEGERSFVQFRNLFPNRPKERPFERLPDFAVKRIRNRVDQYNQKARDYFYVWEVNDEICRTYTGDLLFHGHTAKMPLLKLMLAAALARVDMLAGALCRVDILDKNQKTFDEHQRLIMNFCELELNEGDEPLVELNETLLAAPAPFDEQVFKNVAGDVCRVIEGDGMEGLLRRFADAVRDWRQWGVEHLETLEKAKTRGGSDTRWKKLLPIVRRHWQEFTDAHLELDEKWLWVKFCEGVGVALLRAEKKSAGKRNRPERLLGDIRHEPRTMVSAEQTFLDVSALPVHRFIYTGVLHSETPFHLGIESENEQTSFSVLRTDDGRYRLSRSALRGALRRTIKELLDGGGCNAELETAAPCTCQICRIMSQVTIAESTSLFAEPPELRYRIKRSPFTKIVVSGALFDLETGPQGLRFPFRLYYSSTHAGNEDDGKMLDGCDLDLLKKALGLWSRGMLFVGGQQGTGKGRFALRDAREYQLDLKTGPELCRSLLYRDFRQMADSTLADVLDDGADPQFPLITETPWQSMEYVVRFDSPLLSRDTIAALNIPGLDGRMADTAMTKKKILKEGDAKPWQPFLKSESIRGVLRYAVGKHAQCHDRDHEDCRCELCAGFGSEHGKGLLLFEDAAPVARKSSGDWEPLSAEEINERTVTFDHVAIDRSSGGGVDGLKYDDTPLLATPENPLYFKGSIWFGKSLKEEAYQDVRKMLEMALADLRDGLLPLGGKSSIGYGMVGDLELLSNPLGLELRAKPLETGMVAARRETFGEFEEPELKPHEIYHPYYILSREHKVPRLPNYVSHDRYQPEFTGKMRCRLVSKGPMCVPDAPDLPDEKGTAHPRLQFMRLFGKLAISGATIRGTISPVFEALTNSCMRVLDETHRMSWRMPAEYEGYLDSYLPGRIEIDERGDYWIVQMDSVRLPLYHPEVDNEAGIPVNPDDPIVSAASTVRKRLQNLKPDKLERVLAGKDPIYVITAGSGLTRYVKDLVDQRNKSALKGYNHRTGHNVVAIRILPAMSGAQSPAFTENDYYNNLPFLKCNSQVTKKDNQKVPAIKVVWPSKSRGTAGKLVEYTVTKWFESVFLTSGTARRIKVPEDVRKRFAELIAIQKENTKDLPKEFRTIPLREELLDGDTVYFRLHTGGHEAIDIVPVRISRRMSHKLLGAMIDSDLRPCTVGPEAMRATREPTGDFLPGLQALHPEGLCPACRLFGTTGYGGRVRFGFAHHWGTTEAEGEVQWRESSESDPRKGSFYLLSQSESPRRTWFMPAGDRVDSPLPQVPGQKFYVHNPGKAMKLERTKPDEDNPNRASVELLDAGNVFYFDVHFENLSGEELGLLIYSLELEDGLAHKMGRGKADGLGSVEISVENIVGRDSVSGALARDFTRSKTMLVRCGLEQLEAWFGKPAWQSRWFNNLRKLLWLPPTEAAPDSRYPTLKAETESSSGSADFSYERMKKDWTVEQRLRFLGTPWWPWADKERRSLVTPPDESDSPAE